MKRVLIDTNIVLDVLLNRKDFLEDSTAVIKLLVKQKFRGFVAATTLTNVYYIVCRATRNTDDAVTAVDKILQWCEVAPVNRRVLVAARVAGMPDFEDAVQVVAAQDFGIDIVVTRDKTGFSNSGLLVYSPEEFLETLQ